MTAKDALKRDNIQDTISLTDKQLQRVAKKTFKTAALAFLWTEENVG